MHADGSTFDPNTSELNKKIVKRFTYALTRGSLQDGPGANAIWNITNVTRQDRPCLYTTTPWAKAMSENTDVIAAIQKDPTSPYYADGTDEGIKEAVVNLLDPKTNQFDNQWHNFKPEQNMDDFYAFMVWHRGLAVPRARNEVEAIMWHCYSKKSHAYSSAMNFYKASKSDRDAVVKFLRSI